MAKMKKERLVKKLEENRDMASEAMAKFADGVKADPANAMAWSDRAFADAAMRKAATATLVMLAAADVKTVREEVAAQVRCAARFPPMSTSPASNFAAQCYAAALAQVLEYLEAAGDEA